MDKMNYVVDMLPGITIYHSFKCDPAVQGVYGLCCELCKQQPDFKVLMEHYSTVCRTLYASEFRASLPDYLFDKILSDENAFSQMCAKNEYIRIPLAVKKAAEYDLNILYMVSSISSDDIKSAISEVFPDKKESLALLPCYVNTHKQFSVKRVWGADIISIGDFHRRNGIGIFTKYYAFYLNPTHEITPIKSFHPKSLDSLKKCEQQKKMVMGNTISFLSKKPANHVLLYGDRGTGKSTVVKAILNEYHSRGLRMIQIQKQELTALPGVLATIEHIPLRFILFLDDLSFAENDAKFHKLKSMLDGSLFEMPANVLIYATSNRMHLMRESFSSPEADELHASDTRDEAASLADCFGLTVTFLQPTFEDFIEMIQELAQERKITISPDELRRSAMAFAMRKGARSGRVAQQYINDLAGRLSMETPL